MSWQIVMAITVGIAASVEDLIHRRVSNWIPVVALVAGLIIHFVERGWSGVWAASLGARIGL